MHPQDTTLSKTWRSRNGETGEMWLTIKLKTRNHHQRHMHTLTETLLLWDLLGQPNLNREASNSSRRVWTHR